MAGSWQTSLPGKVLDNEWVSKGIITKTGGEGSIRPTPRTGGGALRFPGRSARPLSPLFYDGTQSRLREGNLRCNVQTVCVDVWGEWNRTTPVWGVNRQASGNLPEMGTRSPADLLAHTRVQCYVSKRTTGGMEQRALVSRLHGVGARLANSDESHRGNDKPSDMRSAAPTTMKGTTTSSKKVLTDGWNYVKVVVGSNLCAEVFFFFLRLDGSAAMGFYEDRITQFPGPSH